MSEIQEEISSFEPGVFEPTRRTLVRFEFGCECNVSDLVDTYVVTDDCHPGDGVSVFSDLTGDTCDDLTFFGTSPVSTWTVAMDHLGSGQYLWELQYDTGEVLNKISNDRPGGSDCIPVGVYEGDGCTANVDYA